MPRRRPRLTIDMATALVLLNQGNSLTKVAQYFNTSLVTLKRHLDRAGYLKLHRASRYQRATELEAAILASYAELGSVRAVSRRHKVDDARVRALVRGTVRTPAGVTAKWRCLAQGCGRIQKGRVCGAGHPPPWADP